ncbi:ABC transporter permease [Streptosporangium sp. KLBMP 9127]|nr:ABC transporter permease [Streptosporangium sp. KLBMP 9127]
MTRYTLRRLLLGLAQIVAVATLVFALTEALPGDAAVVLAGDIPDEERIAQLRHALELDRPAVERWAGWLLGLFGGDLGVSLVSGRPVAELLASSLLPSLLLATATLLALVPISVVAGVVAATREGGLLDRTLTAVTVGLYSIPEFALGVVLVAVFAVGLGWFPPTAVGAGPDLLDQPALLVLPVVVLLARPICSLSRLIRAGMIDALGSGYVRHALRLGLSPRRVRLAHALPNALAPGVQQLARTTDWLLGGVIVVEAVFVIPGLGTVLTDSVAARDIPVIQGLCVLFAGTTILVNLAADLTTFRLTPGAAGTQ